MCPTTSTIGVSILHSIGHMETPRHRGFQAEQEDIDFDDSDKDSDFGEEDKQTNVNKRRQGDKSHIAGE